MKRRFLILSVLLAAAACKQKQKLPQAPPAQSTIVLLPDDDGRVGGIAIANAKGSVDLNSGYSAVHIAASDQPPGAAFTLSQDEVNRVFGSALNVLPVGEKSFLIYFDLNKTEFTAGTDAILQNVLNEIRLRTSTDVSIVGHADSAGNAASNYKIALGRAKSVADSLKALGVDPAILSVESRGDADPLIKTAPGVAEQRNRRVEVLVR